LAIVDWVSLALVFGRSFSKAEMRNIDADKLTLFILSVQDNKGGGVDTDQ